MGIFQKLFKKESPTIVVKQEIDYEKLADAIVKAQMKLKEEEEKKPSATYTFFQIISVSILVLFGFFLLVISLCAGVGIYNNNFSIEVLIIMYAIIATIFIMSILAFIAAREVYVSKKIEFVNNVFIAIMSFSSFITAIVSAVIAYKSM